MMPPTPLASLLFLPATPSPRPQLGLTPSSRRARGTVVRAATFRALPRHLELCPPRLAAVESGPPSSQSSVPPPQPGVESQDAASGFGSGGGDGGGDADLGWVRVFPHVLTASMANFLFGYHIGVMNGPIEDIARELGFQGNPFLQGLVVSIFIVGAFFGSLGSSALVDYLGCKRTLQIDSIPLILGAFISAQAHSLDEMLLGRFLVGIGIGVNTVLVPIYISEVAPTKYRGSLGTLCQIGTCLGIIAALSLGIPSESDPHWWRTMLYAACVPGFLIVAGMQFAVESPRWLAKVGRLDDARKVVEDIWGASEAEKAMEEMKSVVVSDDSQASWSELLSEPHNRASSSSKLSPNRSCKEIFTSPGPVQCHFSASGAQVVSPAPASPTSILLPLHLLPRTVDPSSLDCCIFQDARLGVSMLPLLCIGPCMVKRLMAGVMLLSFPILLNDANTNQTTCCLYRRARYIGHRHAAVHWRLGYGQVQHKDRAVALIGGSLFFLQQFAGINGVLYFSSLTFRDVGITSGILASLYVGITNFGGALVASNLMDKQGRKNLLIGSYLGMAFAMFLIVFSISFPLDEDVGHALSITGTLLYIFTFAIGAGPVTGIIIPELSSARTRSKVMGFSFTVHWICNFLVGLYFLELVKLFGVGAVYAGFGGVSLLTALFAYNFIVETKGRSLEEIEMSLSPAAPGKRK